MQTNLADEIRDTPQGQTADAILRKCVHCGMCTATCPTYQLLGDERDGPRGRIYLIKQVLEGTAATSKTQLHLDRCLSCRACETTCPSGVEYGRLLDIGRAMVDKQVGRGFTQALLRQALRSVIPHRSRFSALLALGRLVRPLLPGKLRRKIPKPVKNEVWPTSSHARKMLLLDGCVQPSLSPNTNTATARVLDKLGITLVRAQLLAGCCGAVSYHLNAREEGLNHARRNIDAWWPHLEQGAEAIVITASGCASMVADYAHLLADDAEYAEKARRVSALTRDISEVIAAEKSRIDLLLRSSPTPNPESQVPLRLAFHAPCSLQHGLKLAGTIEPLLTELGCELTTIPDAHLCCGSAGTYSILQPGLSRRLLSDKIAALTSGAPAAIATANIGCQMHLQSATALPVMHWIELLDQRLGEKH
jgi:glycolate oxidase iron-sulfur subunit